MRVLSSVGSEPFRSQRRHADLHARKIALLTVSNQNLRRLWPVLPLLLLSGPATTHLASQHAPAGPAEQADVLVIGGSPAGVAAAIAAARQGRAVVLVEPRPFLGTVMTGAMLNTFDLDRGRHGESTVQGLFAELYRTLGLTFDPRAARVLFLNKVRAEPRIALHLNTAILRPLLDGTALTGAVVRGPDGPRVIRAVVTIDATDDGDVAAAAGVAYTVGRQTSGIDRVMQPATLLFRVSGINWGELVGYIRLHDKPLKRGGVYLGYAWGYSRIVRHYPADDPTIRAYDLNVGRQPDGTAWINALQIFGVDGTSRSSRREAYLRAKRAVPLFITSLRSRAPGFERAALVEVAPELYIRETRHLRGLYVLTAKDILGGRRFWDRIAAASYPIDLHPYRPGDENPYRPVRHLYTIPLRSLLPQKIDRLFVASRAFSATYQAAASARIVPTTMALGEAAGVAAAVSVERQVTPHLLIHRHNLVALVQRRLQQTGARISP